MPRIALAAALALLAGACSPDAGGEGPTVLTHSFPAVEMPPAWESTSLCQSWTLDNDETLYVNSITMDADPGFHHSNWFYVPEDVYAGPDGTWNCEDRGFDQLEAVTQGGVFFAQSTQAQSETQGFADGAVFRIPPRSRVVGNLHLVNASTTMESAALSFDVVSLPERDADVYLSPMAIQYRPLDIPPQARSRFTTTCDMAEVYNGPLDFDVYYLLPHYHSWGIAMRVDALGGPGGDRTVFDRESSIGTALSRVYDPPLSLGDATHLRVSCDFVNMTDEPIGWGNADAEMCIMVAWTDSGYRWGGGGYGTSTQTGVDEDGVILHEAPCSVVKMAE